MAFWGVEVKPGEPYTHRYHPSHGRLRITQACLGNCDATTKSVVQCNVGDKGPVILCSLNPKLAEMCSIEVELAEENQDVVFSVLGQSAVHLSGYYLGSSRHNGSESYGKNTGVSDTDDNKQPKKSETNMRTLGTGLIIEDLSMGNPDGQIASNGHEVTVNYVGMLHNGNIVDSNVNKKLFEFKLGAGEVIRGWDVGISGMCVGGKRRLTIPPVMGYGDRPMGKIPENSWLIYEVELVSVKLND